MNIKQLPVAFTMIAAAALAGCSTSEREHQIAYASVTDAGYTLPAIPQAKIPPQYKRQIVDYHTSETPGTVIVDTANKFLYYVMPGGKAMRYGIGVGKEGFDWSGTARVAMKREWPIWTPPAPMIKRRPELAEFRGGMQPGLQNPLGPRALYLYKGGNDTGYRLHGTPEWWSIGKAMSSGCIRLLNQDIIDLYNRVDVGAKVIVK
ncbi:L,D-transpeptidase [Phyllobacterium leguminum]|uniref:Lipoprotein-anchoring transpeptidase ErfK/SrfK n=1 Tax=Phyllobacterium leguminum TaxID=314237 RepID=A0A318T3S0_9HYPH|nr:L,D-transpeptidase [Phyllobacterium leguminum]PYE87470.1 lipoprotein-anchoring transpeptidase ErfK/SrfK [Phyllobacterium leguminum]